MCLCDWRRLHRGCPLPCFCWRTVSKVAVLEAAKVGFGASGRNGGQIVNGYSRDIDVIELPGRSRAGSVAGADGVLKVAGSFVSGSPVYNIQCDLKDGGVLGDDCHADG